MNRTETQEFIIGSIFLLANKLSQVGDSILVDITFKQWLLLATISNMRIDELSINTIAEFMGTTRQNIKKMLVPLEKKGYVTICKSLHDARALKVELTEKTYQYYSENANTTTKEAERLFSDFSNNEVANFSGTLHKLLGSFENIYGKDKLK